MATVAEEIAALRGTRRASLKDLLTDPSFSRLWRAMLVSSLGDWVGFVAVAALAARLGGSRLGGLAVAGVMVARLLPSVVFGPFAGVFVDRFDRRKMMIVADVSRGLLYASMPFMPTLALIFVLSFVIECLSLLWTPAKDASLPNLVSRRQLPNANSVGLVTTYGTLPLGATVFTAVAGLSGLIGNSVSYFGRHPEFLALWLDAATFLFSARMVWGLKFRPAVARPKTGDGAKLNLSSALREVRDGVRFLRSNPLIGTMTIGIVVAFGGAGSVISLGPIFARYSLASGSTGFGVLMTALGIGMAIGMASMGLLTKVIDNLKLFQVALLATPLFLVALAAMPTLELAALFTVPLGFGAGLAWVTGYTVLQENVADQFRGRTFATLTVMARLALFVALAVFPALATAIGPRVIRFGGQVLQHAEVRISLWIGAVAVVAGSASTGRGLKRHRLARPMPLRLVPKVLRGDRPGVFIVFEGVEGAGKGTQIELAREYLERKGRDVVVTREPGGTPLGEHLRQALLDPETGTIDPRAEALLFAASRSHHVSTVIRPALDRGRVVLCDRFIDSSVAYQGAGRGLGEQDLLTLNAWATQGLFPDLVVLLHLEPEVGLARAGEHRDRIEGEDSAFHTKVADAFLRIADEHPERYVVVDASTPPDIVHRQVRLALDRVLRTSPPSR